jgi:hypothetical protein
MCTVTEAASSPLPGSPHAPALARAFAQAHVCPEHGRQAEPAVMLLTSELVTRAVVDGASSITVTVECQVSQVRIAVTNAEAADSMAGPTRGSAASSAAGSASAELSLLLIEKIARRWGREVTDSGETFWCTVPTGVIPGRDDLPAAAHPR